MNMSDADEYVKNNPFAYWDGWSLCIFKPVNNAEMMPYSVFKFGRWGIEKKIKMNNEGLFII